MNIVDSIDLRTLRVFDAVARFMSFSVAGRQLDMPRAVVSRLVASLEAQLEVKLFRRTTRKVVLTEQGEQLVQTMLPHLQGLRESLMASQSQTNRFSGVIRVSVSHAWGRAVLMPKIAQFKSLYPEISVHLFLADGIDDLIDDQLDLSLRLGALPDSALIAGSLNSLSVVLVGASSLLKEKGTPKTISSLVRWPCVGFQIPGTGQPYAWMFKRNDQTTSWAPSSPGIVLNSIEAVADAVKAGWGIAPVPKFLMEKALQDGSLRQLLPSYELPSIPLHLCFTDRSLMPARTRALIDFLVDELT
jgi:DNA-binding transcriptional LysR family regulator